MATGFIINNQQLGRQIDKSAFNVVIYMDLLRGQFRGI